MDVSAKALGQHERTSDCTFDQPTSSTVQMVSILRERTCVIVPVPVWCSFRFPSICRRGPSSPLGHSCSHPPCAVQTLGKQVCSSLANHSAGKLVNKRVKVPRFLIDADADVKWLPARQTSLNQSCSGPSQPDGRMAG